MLPPGYVIRRRCLRYYGEWVVCRPDGATIASHSGAQGRRAKASVAVEQAVEAINGIKALLALLRARIASKLPPGVIVNPAWLAAGPGSEVEIHIHPGALA